MTAVETHRVCSECEVEKEITEFYATKRGRRRRCKTCIYRAKLPSVTAWKETHPDRDRELQLQSRRRRETKWKQDAFTAKGGQCERCGIDDHRVLQFDHTNGGGTLERSRKDRVSFYREVALEQRDDIALLCANCHLIAGHERAIL